MINPWNALNGSPSMFARDNPGEPESPKCRGGENCIERWEQDEPRGGIAMFAGFCSIDCREDYFSSVDGGDIRDISFNSASLDDFDEVRYVKSLPSPG